jgi:CheY-like chemotaxis protein
MARILVADDDELVRSFIRLALEAAGHEVREAADGSAALMLIRERAPDVLLCDVFMPGTDGLETLRRVRKESPGVPVVMMSGGGFTGELDLLEVAQALGAAYVLSKPFTIEELLGVVNAALGKR